MYLYKDAPEKVSGMQFELEEFAVQGKSEQILQENPLDAKKRLRAQGSKPGKTPIAGEPTPGLAASPGMRTGDILDNVIEEGLRNSKDKPTSPAARQVQKQDASSAPYAEGDMTYLSPSASALMIQEITKN